MTRKRVLIGVAAAVVAAVLAFATPYAWAYHDATKPFRAPVVAYDVSPDGLTLTLTVQRGGGDELVSARVAKQDADGVDVEVIMKGPGFAPREAIVGWFPVELTLDAPLGDRPVTAFGEPVPPGPYFAVGG